MSRRQARRKAHFPQRVIYCLRYIPNGKVCDIDGGRALAFQTKQAAQQSRCAPWMAQWKHNYRVTRLPGFVPGDCWKSG